MSAVSPGRAPVPELLHYRPWQGSFHAPWHSVWPIARTALALLMRRWLFWVLYGLGMLVFLLFFFGQYIAAFAEKVTADRPGQTNLRQLIHQFLTFLNGTGETYRTFINYQGYIVMIVLALAGSILIGNDLRHGSLTFYLSKPLSPRHYLLGKSLAVAVFINLMTTVPALVLYVEFGLLYPSNYSNYLLDNVPLLLGILAYGAVLTVSLSLLLLATALWLRATVPLIMMWSTLFVFCRLLAGALVGALGLDPRWRLIDLWNNTFLVGNACLGMDPRTIRPASQPTWPEAALVLGGVSLVCLCYLILRIRAVEIVK